MGCSPTKLWHLPQISSFFDYIADVCRATVEDLTVTTAPLSAKWTKLSKKTRPSMHLNYEDALAHATSWKREKIMLSLTTLS